MSVKFRMVTTSLEVKCRKPGGKTVRECIEDANARLTVLEPTLLPLIADRVTQIEALIQPFKTRPSQEALNQVHRLADECLGYCVAIKRPGLAGSLRTVCKLADLLEGNAVWKPGAFLPAIHMIRASLQGGLTSTQVKVLVSEMDQVMQHLAAASAPTPSSNAASA
jgi:hypothetical protein